LDLAIPPGATQNQIKDIQQAVEYGKTVGVKVNIHVYK